MTWQVFVRRVSFSGQGFVAVRGTGKPVEEWLCSSKTDDELLALAKERDSLRTRSAVSGLGWASTAEVEIIVPGQRPAFNLPARVAAALLIVGLAD